MSRNAKKAELVGKEIVDEGTDLLKMKRVRFINAKVLKIPEFNWKKVSFAVP